MTDCQACTNNPLECYACLSNALASSGGSAVKAACAPLDAGAFCLGGYGTYAKNPGGFQHHCGCPNGVADCPGRTQVCTQGVGCQTCGEISSGGENGTVAGQMCQNGLRCNPVTAACE
jgi:hypothetical protein